MPGCVNEVQSINQSKYCVLYLPLVLTLFLTVTWKCASISPEVRQADVLVLRNEYEQAVELYASAMEKYPDNEKLREKLYAAKYNASEKHYREALDLLQQQNIPALESAVEEFDIAISFSPDSIRTDEINVYRAQTLADITILRNKSKDLLSSATGAIDAKRWDEALRILESARKIDPHNQKIIYIEETLFSSATEYYINAAEEYRSEHKWMEGIQILGQAKKYDRRKITSELINTYSYEGKKHHVRLAKQYADAKEWVSCFDHLNRAQEYIHDSEINDLRAMFSNHKSSFEFLEKGSETLERGKKEQDLDLYRDALAFMENARELYQSNPEIRNKLVDSYKFCSGGYERQGYYYNAIELLEQAIEVLNSSEEIVIPEEIVILPEEIFILEEVIVVDEDIVFIPVKIEELKAQLKEHYSRAIELCRNTELFGHALIYCDLIEELGSGDEFLRSQVERELKYKASSNLLVLPFDNLAYGRRDYGSLISEMVMSELINGKKVYPYIQFLTRDYDDKVEREYQRWIESNVAEQPQQSKSTEQPPADLLITGRISEFSVRQPYPKRELKTKRYVSRHEREITDTWQEWRDCKGENSSCVSNCERVYKDQPVLYLLCLANCACGEEPAKYKDVPIYENHRYYKETHEVEATADISWQIVDVGTRSMRLDQNKAFSAVDRDIFIEGFDPANVEYDPLNIKAPEEIEEELLAQIVNKITLDISQTLMMFPEQWYDAAKTCETKGELLEACELIMQCFIYRPEKLNLYAELTTIRDSLRINQLTSDAYQALVYAYGTEMFELPEQPGQIADDQGERWALVVGISNYQDNRIPSVRYATVDAQEFYRWLIAPDGGRYAPSRVKLLINEDATTLNIKSALFNWLRDAIDEDIITIYFAGHGTPESPQSPDNLFLLTYDSELDNIASTAFPMWEFETALNRYINADKVIIITDACHSGGIGAAFDVASRDTRGMKGNPIGTGFEHLTNVGDGICVFSASSDNQLSIESQDFGGGHGVFTHYLLQGLKGEADFNPDGVITMAELIQYVSEEVRRATQSTQTPIVAGRYDPMMTISR